MNTINYYKLDTLPKSIVVFCLSLIMILTSCKDDLAVDGAFALKDNPSKLAAAANGVSETYTVQATGKWKVEPLRKENWVKIDPMEGNGNGTFTVTVYKNTDPEARELTLFFTLDGKLQNNVLKVEQAGTTDQGQVKDPYLKIDGISNRLEVLEDGITGQYILRATGKWKVALEDESEWESCTYGR